jgi:uncharacterized protein (DUF952 family)
MILHITTRRDWESAVLAGKLVTSSLQSEGFIHCSTAKQAAETANIFFKAQKGLVLLCIDEEKLTSELRYEAPTAGGAYDLTVGKMFPHIYGPINLEAVQKIVDFPPSEDGSFTLPRDLE